MSGFMESPKGHFVAPERHFDGFGLANLGDQLGEDALQLVLLRPWYFRGVLDHHLREDRVA